MEYCSNVVPKYCMSKTDQFIIKLALYLNHTLCPSTNSITQGGNFHLKVGGAKSCGNAGDPILGVAVIP